MADAKKLRIQTGVVNRTFKEKQYYQKELAAFEKKLQNQNFKDEEEAYRAKMIPQQIDETKAALKDTENALQNAIIALRQLVEDEAADKSTKEWVAASDKLKEVTA
ncbi:Oidioi.mRNA.OKI2018_I69.XSR.g14594.t1.cds [Oikopleura dioica]|uniref:Tubulin-specific chaperone A n=1 Tax=Oikopleura dioica TaxID=34765 RepID=A0ABN7SAC4_OIKDI|nr:Oidioi.mRNA.OKI2018_I69.XSR.g14594.t1.cds [Oikopleura dioica]